jgi:type I restriction enzyme, S subunit
VKKGWERKRISEIAQHSLGKMLDRSKNKGEFKPYLRNLNVRWGEFDLSHVLEMRFLPDEASRYTAIKGDVLVCEGGYPGRAAIWDGDEPIYFQKALHRVRFHEPERNKWFLYFLQLRDLEGSLKSHFNGAGIQHFTGEALARFEMPLPPLPEQQRIVGLLDQALAGLATAQAHAEKNLQNARALFESHLQSIFTRRNKGWAVRQLDSLCREITVGHVGPMKTQYKESGVPFLRSQNVRAFEISMENVMFIDGTFHRSLRKSQLRPGDLAIVRTGFPGTAAVIPSELPDCNCSDLVIVRPSEEVNPNFLAAFFNSAFGKQLVLGKIVGAAQKHFNITAAKQVMLHVPPPIEQSKIAEAIGALRAETQRLESLYQQKVASVAALKKSLLHQAFTGAL